MEIRVLENINLKIHDDDFVGIIQMVVEINFIENNTWFTHSYREQSTSFQ